MVNNSTTIRLPPLLRAELENEAKDQNTKLSPLIVKIIGEWLVSRDSETRTLKDVSDWRTIVNSPEWRAAWREVFLQLREDWKIIMREVLLEQGPSLVGAQRDVVIGVFNSPEYQRAVKDLIHQVLTSPEFHQANGEAAAQVIRSPEFTEVMTQVIKNCSPG